MSESQYAPNYQDWDLLGGNWQNFNDVGQGLTNISQLGSPAMWLQSAASPYMRYEEPGFLNLGQGGYKGDIAEGLFTTARGAEVADRLAEQGKSYGGVSRPTGWGDVARGVGMGLGGLTLGLGALNAWDQYKNRNADRNLRREQLDMAKQAQNFSLGQAQKQVASNERLSSAYNAIAEANAKWQLTKGQDGRLVYVNRETGQVANSRPAQSAPIMAAKGGLAQCSCGGHAEMARGGASRPVSGPGTGQSDEIPALLSDGEYVLDASTVSDLGDGSTKAGAQALDKFVKKVRTEKRGGLSQLPKKAKAPEKYMKKAV